ncbi:MAG: glycosyltransferase family 2 protein, partial [Deltaproteobacteria bacterium]
AIGFDKFIIATNDCEDGTDDMVRRLAEIEDVVHVPNQRVEGEAIQITALKRIMAHPEMDDVEWALHCDSDEFLWVALGSHQVQDLIAAVDPVDTIIISWRMFGSNGLRRWKDGLILETFDKTEARIMAHVVQQKSLFRPDKFRGANAHMPKRPVSRDIVMTNTKGEVIPNDSIFRRRESSHQTAPRSAMTWANADIHHYAARSLDTFLLKNVRGIGADKVLTDRYTLGSKWLQRCDKNDVEDRQIQRFLPEVKARMAVYLADPVLGPLHQKAYDWFDALRAEYLDTRGEFGWNDPPES